VTELSETKFQPNEPDNVRRPKLQRLLEHLIAAEEITLDDAIAAIAALTPATDTYIYFTSPTAAALGTITAFGRSILDDANGPAVLVTIGAQPLDSTLTSLAAYNTNGILVQTAADAFTGRTLTGPAAGITVSNGNGVAGNPTLALANDLGALEALSGTNTIYYRSGVDTWTAVTIGGLLSFSGGTLNIGDAELSAIAGLTSAADRVPYFTGSGTAALATFTASGRTVVAASGVTGTGNVVFSASPTFTGTVNTAAITASSTIAVSSDGATLGGIRLERGTDGGYMGFYDEAAARHGYIGFPVAGPRMGMVAESPMIGFSITGDLLVSGGIDVTGLLRGDTFRLDATATAGVVAGTHTIPISINGTAARMIVAIP
jgi:hypothetical protein